MKVSNNQTLLSLLIVCGGIGAASASADPDRIPGVVPWRIVAHNEQGGLRHLVGDTAGGIGCRGEQVWFAPVVSPNAAALGSTVTGLSPDGLVAVGWSLVPTESGVYVPRSFTWTPCDGMSSINNLPESVGGQALAAAMHGEVIVGIAHGATDKGFRMFAQDSADIILDQADLYGTSLRAVSSDGSIAVGSGADAIGQQAIVFADGWDHVQSLGDLAGGNAWSDAYGVSGDGSVVVGQSFSASGPQAFVWTEASGMVGLGDLPGGAFDSAALAVSANGLVIVGVAHTASGPQAFRWTAQSGMIALGDLPGGPVGSEALAVSADGTVIVGRSLTEHGFEAFVWMAGTGMRHLRSLITSRIGTDVDVPLLTAANGISADGSMIGGSASASGVDQGWVAHLVMPLCIADWNDDGAGNSLDYFDFLQDFFEQNADVNGDGATDTADFFSFLSAFFTGCQ